LVVSAEISQPASPTNQPNQPTSPTSQPVSQADIMHASKTCDQTDPRQQTFEPFRQQFKLILYGKHSTSYTIDEPYLTEQLVKKCVSATSQLEELRQKLAYWFRRCLPDGLPDGHFWEFKGVWTSNIEFVEPERMRYLTYFPQPFDPNEHVLVTMLADPHEPSFGSKVVYRKNLGLAAIQQDMAKLTKSEFVLANQDYGKVLDCQAEVEAQLVFVACLPKARLRHCTVDNEAGMCIDGRIGDMRVGIAKLNDWKLDDTDACVVGIDAVSDDYDTTELGKYEENAQVHFSCFDGGLQAAKNRWASEAVRDDDDGGGKDADGGGGGKDEG